MPTVESLSIRWREALDAAEDAYAAAGRCGSLRFAPDELRTLNGDLLRERNETEHVLQELATEMHSRVHRRLTGPRANAELLGLDRAVHACVFDLDGVLTASAALHAAAWQETFDELLARHHESSGEHYGPWRPFDVRHDYDSYIHGRPRLQGVHTFLASRGIRLAEGSPTDRPGTETAFGLANRKNEVLQRRLSHDGVSAFDGSIRFLEVAHEAGLRCAVVSASANTREILARSGLGPLIDDVVDGEVIRTEHLKAKPDPDWVLAACRRLALSPAEVATFETTSAGIEAGRVAGAHRVIVVDRSGRAAQFREEGADRVVSDLGDLIDPSLG